MEAKKLGDRFWTWYFVMKILIETKITIMQQWKAIRKWIMVL